MTSNYAKEKSPCVQICSTYNNGIEMVCCGCNRTQDEIREWPTLTNEEIDAVLERLHR